MDRTRVSLEYFSQKEEQKDQKDDLLFQNHNLHLKNIDIISEISFKVTQGKEGWKRNACFSHTNQLPDHPMVV